MPWVAVLRWPTAAGGGRALLGPSCISMHFNANQQATEQDERQCSDRGGHVGCALV